LGKITNFIFAKGEKMNKKIRNPLLIINVIHASDSPGCSFSVAATPTAVLPHVEQLQLKDKRSGFKNHL
jgi:hypothetical protein